MSTEPEAMEEPGASRRSGRCKVLSVVVPVYGNEGSLPELIDRLSSLALPAGVQHQVVFVVDGSPDGSEAYLRSRLASWSIPSTLVVLSRNFGSFAAIRAGLKVADGDYFAVMAADLQEPPELLNEFAARLASGEHDIVLGERLARDDPAASRAASGLYWRVYRRFVQPSMPPGGVDVFACNRKVRAAILQLDESNSSLVGLLLWIGFRRTSVPYVRQARTHGTSGWTLSKKVRYMADSIFSFTDLPIRLLLIAGVVGCVSVVVLAVVVLVAWAVDLIDVEGYTPLMLSVLFVGGLLTFALGIVGSYVWRTYENTKGRPLTLEQSIEHFPRS